MIWRWVRPKVASRLEIIEIQTKKLPPCLITGWAGALLLFSIAAELWPHVGVALFLQGNQLNNA